MCGMRVSVRGTVCVQYTSSVEEELLDRILNHPIEAFMHVFPCDSAASHDVPFVCFDAF